MGLLDVFRLAGDYRKAKKALKEKKIDVKKAEKIIEGIKELIDILYKYKDEVQELISEIKDVLKQFKKLKEEKENE